MDELAAKRIARRLTELAEELGLYDLPPEVCVTHKRFVPCRRDDKDCIFSSLPDDVKMVREFQAR